MDKIHCPHCLIGFVLMPERDMPVGWERIRCWDCGKLYWIRYPNGPASRLVTPKTRPPKIHIRTGTCKGFTTDNVLAVDCKICQKLMVKRLEAGGWHVNQNILIPPVSDRRIHWTAKWLLWHGPKLRFPHYVTYEDVSQCITKS